MRILLSYNANDVWLIEALYANLFMLGPELYFSLSPARCAERSRHNTTVTDIRQFDGLLLVAGPSGLSPQQENEWDAAIRLTAQDDRFVAVLVIAGSARPPKKINLAARDWFEMPVVTDRDAVHKLIQTLKSCKS